MRACWSTGARGWVLQPGRAGRSHVLRDSTGNARLWEQSQRRQTGVHGEVGRDKKRDIKSKEKVGTRRKLRKRKA